MVEDLIEDSNWKKKPEDPQIHESFILEFDIK